MVFSRVLRSARMSRALCVVAALAILVTGCASRSRVSRLELEVARLRAELAAARSSQDLTTADLARIAPEVRALDERTTETQSGVKALSEEVARLGRRVDAADRAISDTRARVEALAVPVSTPPVAVAPPPARPAVSPPAPPVVTPTQPPAVTTAPSPVLTPAPGERPREAQAPHAISPEQVYAAALAAFRSREHGQAVLDFLDFIAKYPRHSLAANAQYWIGEAYYAQRDYRQALVEFQKVLEYGPAKAPDALVKMGMGWVKLRDVRRAQDLWQRAVRDYPKSEAAVTAQQLLHTHATVQR